MGTSSEIITLQFGNYTNYCGTHWWNIQEAQFNYDSLAEPSEINHDVLFREGKTLKGDVTFTPRLLLVDLKGSIKGISYEGELYKQPELNVEKIKTEVLWEQNKCELLEEPKPRKNEYQQDLESSNADIENKEYNFVDTVQEWSDFMYSKYHPRSVNLISNFQHEISETSFDTFACGMDLWKSPEFDIDFSDKIRNYIEESDSCQGFQVLFDIFDGFSGLSVKCMEYLNDEYGKSLLSIPIFAPKPLTFKNCDGPMGDSIRLMNIALSYSHLAEVSSLFIPLSTMTRCWRTIGNSQVWPHVSYQQENFYQTSGIIGTYLDTITLRYRLRHPAANSYLSGFCSDMNAYSRKMVSAGIALPFNMLENEDLIEYLDRVEGPLFRSLSPNCNLGTDHVIQSICIRGIPDSRLKKPREKASHQLKMAAYKCNSVSEMIQLYYQCNYYSSHAHVTSIDEAIKIKKPYPLEIFSSKHNPDGFMTTYDRPNNEKISSVPVFANVQSSSALSNTLESLHRDVKRIKFGKIHRFKESGMEQDEYEETLEQLLNFKENYDEGFQL